MQVRGARTGLFRHKSSTGLALGTNQVSTPDGTYTGAAWTLAGVTVTSDRNQTDPFGGSIASGLTAIAGLSLHRLFQPFGPVGPVCRFSFYGKAGTTNFIGMGNNAGDGAVYNVSAGTFSNVSGAATNVTMVSQGGGWWKCSWDGPAGATPVWSFGDTAANAVQGTSWTAAGTETWLIVRLSVQKLG